jgi:outer membrane lipoprotein-sorting protein
MMRKILAVSLVLVMALTFVACDGEDLPSAEEIIEGMTQAVVDVRTGEFDMEMTMDVDAEVEGESGKANIEMDASGVMDIENCQMQIAMTMQVEATGEEDVDMAAEVYLIDNTFYMMTDALGMMTDVFGMGPTWLKLELTELEELEEMEELPEGYWNQEELLEFQQELLEASEIEVTGSERVDGIDCYVLESNPDMKQLWQTVMEMYETTGLDMTDMPEDFVDYLDEMFDSFTQKLWVAKDTYLPMKVEVEMTMDFTAEDVGSPDEEGEVAVDLFMSMLIFNYNQPVSIELPPEAEDAMDIMDFTDYMDY